MFNRVSRVRASLLAAASVVLVSSAMPVSANLIWGGGPIEMAAQPSIASASLLNFNQMEPVVVNEYGTIPTTTFNTQFATNLITNVNGAPRLVMQIRYADGSVYSIVNPDATLAAQAASTTTNVTLTGQFSFAVDKGQTVLREQIIVNGVTTYTVWGRSSSIVNAFATASGTARNLIWGGAPTMSAELSID